uniref:GH07729p n=1 Tax=Drosophila melanogaster TaxID=7227 RepID=Q8SXC5_DROME|nr:GH07729p [Drosophila melanogaster]
MVHTWPSVEFVFLSAGSAKNARSRTAPKFSFVVPVPLCIRPGVRAHGLRERAPGGARELFFEPCPDARCHCKVTKIFWNTVGMRGENFFKSLNVIICLCVCIYVLYVYVLVQKKNRTKI